MIKVHILKRNKSTQFAVETGTGIFNFTINNRYLSTRLNNINSQKDLQIFLYNYILNICSNSGIRQLYY